MSVLHAPTALLAEQQEDAGDEGEDGHSDGELAEADAERADDANEDEIDREEEMSEAAFHGACGGCSSI